MKVIDEIIDLLTSKEVNLQSAFLKTKILLHKLGESQSKEWINKELNGYSDDDNVPSYRLVRLEVFGNIGNGICMHNNQSLVLSHLNKKLKDSLTKTYMRDNIGNIEEFSKEKKLDIAIPPELYSTLSEPYNNEGGYMVQRAWRTINTGAMNKIIIEVKSKLLDFMLELSEKIPNNADNDLKLIAKDIDVSRIFDKTVFGNNATVIIGNSNNPIIGNGVLL